MLENKNISTKGAIRLRVEECPICGGIIDQYSQSFICRNCLWIANPLLGILTPMSYYFERKINFYDFSTINIEQISH